MDQLRAQIRRQVAGILRHKWIAVAIAWIICVGGWAGVAAIPNKYEADARIYIDADAVLTPLLHGIALDDPLAAQIEVLQRTLLSRPKLEKLISKTDLSLEIRDPSDLERMIARLTTQIAVVPQTKNLFTITYRNDSPRLAYDVVRTILGIFVEDKTGTNRADMANANSFINEQITTYEQQLREAEARRAEFRTKYLDVLPADGTGMSRLDEAREATRRLEGQLADARDRRDRLAREVAATPLTIAIDSDVGPGGAPSAGHAEVAAAEAKLRELRATLTDQNPDVIRQEGIVASLRASTAASASPAPSHPVAGRSEPNPVYQQLKVMLVQADGDLASMTRQVEDSRTERDRLQKIVRDAPTVQAQYVNLNRDYDVLRKNYEELLARRESMRIAAAADAQADKVKLEVVDPPQIPHVPVAPKRALLISGVLAAGMGGGIAAAFLLGQFDRSFQTVLDLRSLGVPVAGAVSLVTTRVTRRRRLRAFGVAMAMVAFALLGAAYAGLMYQVLVGAGTA